MEPQNQSQRAQGRQIRVDPDAFEHAYAKSKLTQEQLCKKAVEAGHRLSSSDFTRLKINWTTTLRIAEILAEILTVALDILAPHHKEDVEAYTRGRPAASKEAPQNVQSRRWIELLCGRPWWLYYYTQLGKPADFSLNQTHVEFHPDETFTLSHGKRKSGKTKLIFKGTVRFETGKGIRFTLDGCSQDPLWDERIAYRFTIPMDQSVYDGHRPKRIFGAWLGIGFNELTSSSGAFLDDDGEIADGKAAGIIAAAPQVCPCAGAASLHTHDKWQAGTVAAAIANFVPAQRDPLGASLDFCSTYFPEYQMLSDALSTLHGKLDGRWKKTRRDDTRLRVRILLTNPIGNNLLRTRFSVFSYAPGFEGIVAAQAQVFLDLQRTLAERMSIAFKFYRTWPFGHCVRVGSKTIFYGPLLAHDSAINGQMFEYRDPTSPIWKTLETNLDRTFDHAWMKRDYPRRFDPANEPVEVTPELCAELAAQATLPAKTKHGKPV